MSRGRLALLVVIFGVLGSQAGHLLAYELRFGGAAAQLQSTGAHAYFPTVAKTGLGIVSLATLAGLVLVGIARVAAGRAVPQVSSPSFMRVLASTYTLQLAIFGVQETLEAVLGGGHPGSAPLLLLWGAFGQLPVAIAAALALRWLLVRVRPALSALRLGPVYQWIVEAVAIAPRPVATADAIVTIQVWERSGVRGPPSF